MTKILLTDAPGLDVSLRQLGTRERLRVTAPSMFTTGNMACGFSAILLAFSDEFMWAAVVLAGSIVLSLIRARLHMVYVEACRGSAAVTLRRDAGSRIPLATTAMGKAYLCGLPQNDRDFLMDHIRLTADTNWPKIKTDIEQGFKDYQDRGFVLSSGLWDANISAVGVPLLDPDIARTMAFNCGGPATITTPIKPASWSYAEAFIAEDDVLAAARARALQPDDSWGNTNRWAELARDTVVHVFPAMAPEDSERVIDVPVVNDADCGEPWMAVSMLRIDPDGRIVRTWPTLRSFLFFRWLAHHTVIIEMSNLFAIVTSVLSWSGTGNSVRAASASVARISSADAPSNTGHLHWKPSSVPSPS